MCGSLILSKSGMDLDSSVALFSEPVLCAIADTQQNVAIRAICPRDFEHSRTIEIRLVIIEQLAIYL